MYASIYLTTFVFFSFFSSTKIRADMFEAFLFASHMCPLFCDVLEAS